MRTMRGYGSSYDPQLGAFLRAMGVQEQQVRAQGRQQSALASRQVARQNPLFDQRIGDAAQEIGGDAESRGVYRSGSTVTRLADSRNRIEAERNEVQATLRDQLQGIQYDTASRVAELRRQGAEERLSGRSRAGERQAKSVYGGSR
jgi:hypothetical protein